MQCRYTVREKELFAIIPFSFLFLAANTVIGTALWPQSTVLHLVNPDCVFPQTADLFLSHPDPRYSQVDATRHIQQSIPFPFLFTFAGHTTLCQCKHGLHVRPAPQPLPHAARGLLGCICTTPGPHIPPVAPEGPCG